MEKAIGQRISQARKAQQLTQEELSELCGLSVSTISRLETGSCSTSLKTLYDLSQVLNVGLDYVLYDIIPGHSSTSDPLIIDVVSKMERLNHSQKEYISNMVSLYIKYLEL